jgi:hypothetical protein
MGHESSLQEVENTDTVGLVLANSYIMQTLPWVDNSKDNKNTLLNYEPSTAGKFLKPY